MRKNIIRGFCAVVMALMLLAASGCAGYFEYMKRTALWKYVADHHPL